MNPIKLSASIISLSIALSLSASAQPFDEINVSFGSLYGDPPPTTVLSGTGTLGESLVGDEFFWVCMDAGQTQPSLTTASYYVSTDSAVMQAGIWGGTLDADARQGIITAATNMFYAYQNELLTSSGSEIGYGYQSALWGIQFAYTHWGASGPLSSAVVDEVVSRYDIYFEDEPWLELFLDAALTTPTGDTTFYFANPVDDSTLQPIMLFPATPVPEPSSTILVALGGLLCIFRRRRSA